MKYRGAIAGFVWGTIYALLFAYIFSLSKTYSIQALEYVSIAMLIVTPVSVGVITVFFATKEQANNKQYRLYHPWFPILGWAAISLIFAWETIVCVFMLLPLYMPLATIGGLLGGYIRDKYCEKTNSVIVSCIAIFPLLIAPIETPLESPTTRVSVSDSILIDAPISQVWNSLPNIENIKSDELPKTLSHHLGIPRPIAATTKELKIGGIREIYWEKGVHFQEKITFIEENKTLAYDVLVDEESMKIAELDTHIVVGDQYFDVESGRYELEDIDGKTLLTLTTTYRMTSKLNWYGKFWANYVLDDFHNSVLKLIKDRNES